MGSRSGMGSRSPIDPDTNSVRRENGKIKDELEGEGNTIEWVKLHISCDKTCQEYE